MQGTTTTTATSGSSNIVCSSLWPQRTVAPPIALFANPPASLPFIHKYGSSGASDVGVSLLLRCA
ncbi:hypothetical protein GGTG_08386 [Gaeumannomyces tritici R3-111a-1]|uniref:Uncharacterized protein n=1 Tax=Gaeumannomyces tritici (strain R3-111a-1) TaxID=644352 RepID=J3P4E9_GAET3|nr:hypothetical protein GGTG_08386 [Gaeumannomyces tritici R3-111a-1]EJT74546.1 hypothetical protein GGTG_08386 [Gaeumannomyces tritici R3-111a-1]